MAMFAGVYLLDKLGRDPATLFRFALLTLTAVPMIFLVGLLRARLARSGRRRAARRAARADRARRAAGLARPRAARPEPRARLLGARVRGLRRRRRRAAAAADATAASPRYVERHGTPVAAMIHDATLQDEPRAGRRRHLRRRDRARERAPAGRPARPPERPARLARPHRRGRRHRPPQARARPPRRRPAAARDLDVVVLRLVAGKVPADSKEAELLGPPARSSTPRWRSCATSRAASTPRSSATTGCRSRWNRSPPARRSASTLDVDLPERPPPQVEVAAYYLIAEGLTNVAKYAEAESATVDVDARATAR